MRNYPKVPRTDVKDTYFGVTIEDPYRYLEDKKAPEVLDIVAQENAYTKAVSYTHLTLPTILHV